MTVRGQSDPLYQQQDSRHRLPRHQEVRNRLPGSFFDTVCAFLNTDGGTIYLGVGDNGAVTGVEPQAVDRLKSDIANLSNNPRQLGPPFLLFPRAVTVDGKTVITVQVPLYANGATPVFQETEHSFTTTLPLVVAQDGRGERVIQQVTP